MSRHWNFILPAIFTAFLFTKMSGFEAYAQELDCRPDLSHVPSLFRQDTLTICILGDVMMHTKQIETARKGEDAYDFSSYFKALEGRIKGADIAVANMEFTLGGKPYTGYPSFSAPDSYATYLTDCGFDVFLAANNHILDKGSQGADRTIEIYRHLEDMHGIRFTGIAGNEEERSGNFPLAVRRKGITVSLINFTYGTNLGGTAHWPKTNYMSEREEIQKALKKAESADFSIVLPHWGEEYRLTHSARQEETAGWLAENGADAIIGAHPHVVQDTATVKGIPVVYSLGNAVSNMSAENTQLELMATLRIVRHANGDLQMLTPELTWLWCSRPGGYTDNYAVIPVEEFIGTRDTWQGGWEYDKMVATYNRIRNNK